MEWFRKLCEAGDRKAAIAHRNVVGTQSSPKASSASFQQPSPKSPLPSRSHRHQQTHDDLMQVISLSPFYSPLQISELTTLPVSVVRRDLANPSSFLLHGTRLRRPGGGQQPLLTAAEEKELKDWILMMNKWGAEVTPSIVREKARMMFEKTHPGFTASHHWYERFLLRNHLKEMELTPTHASITAFRKTSPSSRTASGVELSADLERKKDTILDFITSFYILREKFNVSDDRILAGDDTRIGYRHAKTVVCSDDTEKPKCRALGFERAQPNFFVAVRSDGELGVPVMMCKGTEQSTVPIVEAPLSSFVASSSSSSSSSSSASKQARPVLTCFTQYAHTTGTSYAAELQTAVREALPNGGILVHDSDRAHLTQHVQETLQQLQIMPVVIPPGNTDCCSPLDRVVNAQIQNDMNKAQRRWFISLLEENQGTLPNISQESFNALMLAWFRDAVYSVTRKSIHSAWRKCGLLYRCDEKEDGEVFIKLAHDVVITGLDMRMHIERARLEAKAEASSASSLSVSSRSQHASSSSPAPALESQAHAKFQELQARFSTILERTLNQTRTHRARSSSSASSSGSTRGRTRTRTTSPRPKARRSRSRQRLARRRSASPTRRDEQDASHPPLRHSTRTYTPSSEGLYAQAVDFTFEREESTESGSDSE